MSEKDIHFDNSIDDIMVSGMSSKDIDKLINKLKKTMVEVKRKEDEEEKKKKEAEFEEAKHIEEVTSMDLPLNWSNTFSSSEAVGGIHTDSIPDALVMSLHNLGRVDIEYISAVTGYDMKTCIGVLKGSIYQDPAEWEECFWKGWKTADEYLSGNLARKLNIAKEESLKYKGYFDINVRAIEKVLPPSVKTGDIYVTLGSPWIPADIIDSFIYFLFGGHFTEWYYKTKHDELTGTWEIPYKSRYRGSVATTKTYGTACINALHILEKTLNMKSVAVTKKIFSPTNKSGEKTVIDKEETLIAMEKQEKLISAFKDWIWRSKERKERLTEIFESRYGCVLPRSYDGSFLEFPTMSKDASLYPYQKNAVARILFSPNTLLAHDVGAGKTYIMIAAAMELRRMGISKKNMFVVPNNLIGQWRGIFKSLYPDANIKAVTPYAFRPEKRKILLTDIRDKDYDAIIIPYSCFEMIPLSKQFLLDSIEKQHKEITAMIRKNGSITALERKKKKLSEELRKTMISVYTADAICFDELGINTLFVDEAHNFKNLPLEFKADHVMGLSKSGSKKCEDMLGKVHCVQQQNNGRGVVFATGTPITNSITDIFVMQKFLQNGELGLLDLSSFDAWIGMFAEKETSFEIDVDTSGYRMATRFSKFHNLPELTSLIASFADFHKVNNSAELPEFNGYSDALIGKSAEFAAYLEDISRRADEVRKGRVSRKDDNMLLITTDGRKAALDIRLVEPQAAFTYQSKVARCAENVYRIYRENYSKGLTQLVFCDTSTPKAGFNIYDELRDMLITMGVAPNHIAYVHDATSESKRNKLFEMMRKGEIRILIGSTFKLGIGVNVQDKLVALHHLDIPWRPADMVQREGRILRQGNQNGEIKIFRYITEGSFDAYSWQLLETKQRFIQDILSGSVVERSGNDVDDTVLNYAEIKALAIGNPLIKKRVEIANELNRYIVLQRKTVEERQRMEQELSELPAKQRHQNDLINKCIIDMGRILPRCEDKDERKALRKIIYDAVQNNVLNTKEEALTSYRGFDIILPSGMTAEKPFVWLQNKGRYYVELGDSEKGVLIRLDNFLDDMSKHLERLYKGLNLLRDRKRDLELELCKNISFVDDIESLSKELAEIDKELGVKK